MKKNAFYFSLIGIALGAMLFTTSCKDDPEEVTALTLSTLVAGDIDLNGATAPSNVEPAAVITATFATAVDASTATAANISLVQDYDDAIIDIDIEVNGAVITITPTERLGGGTLYALSFETGLKATNGQILAAEIVRSFTTDGVFIPKDPVAYWKFEDNANDEVGNYDASAAIDITYTASTKTISGKAATFNGSTSIIEIPNADELINTNNFSLCFWMKTNSTGKTGGHFVIGLGAFYGIQYEVFGGYDGAKFAVRYNLSDTNSTVEDMWFPSNATYADNGGWQGWDFAKSIEPADMMLLLKDAWLHVVFTYDAATKSGKLFYNGEKMKSFDFDLWPDGDAKRAVSGLTYAGVAPEVVNEMAFGFIQSRAGTLWDNEPWGGYEFPDANHFKGQLDDIVIYDKAITEAEVLLMYNSAKP